jgi:hypothetical protein
MACGIQMPVYLEKRGLSSLLSGTQRRQGFDVQNRLAIEP